MTTINHKVEHVLRAKQTRQHKCHWPTCNKQVKPAMWGCVRHWKLLPKKLRDKIWSAYQPGQEQTGRVSIQYLEVASEVQKWIHEHGWRLDAER